MARSEKKDLWAFGLSLLVLPASVLVTLPLLVFWLLALGVVLNTVHVASPVDWYRLVWCTAAVMLALIHIVQCIRNFRSPSSRRATYMVACSALIVLTCPVFWGW